MLLTKFLKQDRLGVYWVNNTPYTNKSEAVNIASQLNADITWSFNDSIFSSIDWSVPINKSLKDLYKERAQQLRDQYDYLSLCFSGGVDSTNILNAFIENNILLDEVVMYYPVSEDNNFNKVDTSSKNIYAEIKFAAIPYLNKYLKDTRTVVRVLDIGSYCETFLTDPILCSQYSKSLNVLGPNAIPRLSIFNTDRTWRGLYNSGKNICHIHGFDKPYVQYEGEGKYSFRFTDFMACAFEAGFSSPETDAIHAHQHHEAFYWTPSMPEIVIKQCQVVKEASERDPAFRALLTDSVKYGQRHFDAVCFLVYPPEVNIIRTFFSTAKFNRTASDPANDWVVRRLSHKAQYARNYLIDFTLSKVSEQYLYSNIPIREHNAFINFKSKKYFF